MQILEDHPLLAKIETALDSVRPYLNADGGDVKVLEINDLNEVLIEFLGACSACNMSAMTFRAGIQDAIMKAVPDVTKVIAKNI
jgi:Fe-S cluster biogenesis protein NfuA